MSERAKKAKLNIVSVIKSIFNFDENGGAKDFSKIILECFIGVIAYNFPQIKIEVTLIAA